MKVRLHKAIADAGIASRRAAEEMIRQGRVAVNGEVVTAMGVTVDPRTDSITVDGSPLGQADRKRTYLFYKPPGYICTRDDPHGRSTVFDILPDEVGTGLHTAGRLDMDAEGLLILTNDGELTLTLTHPSSHLPKTYLVKVKGEVQLRGLKKLRRGVELDDGVTLPASVSVILGKGTDRNTWLRMVLREGRKNQIKRMCDAVGHRVLSIKRISIGGMMLPEKMKQGSFKKLSKKEIETLIGGKDKIAQNPKSKAQRGRAAQSPKPNAQRGRPESGPTPRRDRSGQGEKVVQSPSPYAKASSFAKATEDKSADRKSRVRREHSDPETRRHGDAEIKRKPEHVGKSYRKPGEKGRRGDATEQTDAMTRRRGEGGKRQRSKQGSTGYRGQNKSKGKN